MVPYSAPGEQCRSLKRITIPRSAASALVARCLGSTNTADELRGHVPPTTSVRGAGVGPTKVLSENPLCRSLSSIHILYNQAIVGEMGPLLASARQIDNVSLPGGSTGLTRSYSIRTRVAPRKPVLLKIKTIAYSVLPGVNPTKLQGAGEEW